MALQLSGIRARRGGKPRDGSDRVSHLRALPPPAFLTLSRHRGQVDNAPVAAPNWYQTLTCGSSTPGSSKRPNPGQPSRLAG
ncbi:unnamed protein product [Schistocephalus solidus]|uniref:Uncharacterized protein n=1 Tax=Schistocephalus solidus TaxID=70667 RepID=A0A183SSU3_SCHSO|nr:unnamed protein product [Schistocephalus solidus]